MIFTIGAVQSKVGLSRLMERPPRSTKLAAGEGADIHVMSSQAIPSLLGLALGPPSIHAVGLSSIVPAADATSTVPVTASGTSDRPPTASGSQVAPNLVSVTGSPVEPAAGASDAVPQAKALPGIIPPAYGYDMTEGQIDSQEDIP